MNYKITNASIGDLQVIYHLFEAAIEFQRVNNYIGWSGYDKEFIHSEIENGTLFKIEFKSEIACIFSICLRDDLIWRQREIGDALYLHRVVINQRFSGRKLFKKVLEWSVDYGIHRDLKFIRLDTWAANKKLIAYYNSYGFLFVEDYTTPTTIELPVQHRNLNVALLEFKINHSSCNTLSDEKKCQKLSTRLEKINILHELSNINKYWNQIIIGDCNGQLIKLAKGIGEINWHKHDDQDELFIVYKGHLTIQLKNQDIELYPNDMFIVPKGFEHCPKADGEVEFLIMGLNITSNKAGGRPEHFA